MAKKSVTLDHKCPNCSAKMVYDIKLEKWHCDYCDTTMTLEELKKYKNASTSKEENITVDEYNDYMSYTCPDCGAEIITDEQTASTFCVYCGNTAILKNKLVGKFTPNKIITFKKTKEDAEKAFKNLSKGRPLIPKAFNDLKNVEKIRGLYIPFWFHSFEITGDINYSGQKVQTWVVGRTHYTKTDYYDIVRGGSMIFDSVPVDGSTRFDNALMNTIQPYDYAELKPYNHAYLSGFLAERYDVESNETRKEVEPEVLDEAKNYLLSKGDYVNKRIKENTLKTNSYNIEYVLLPVYMVNVKYNNKYYTFAMNGQTGEFIGNIPVDKKKAILLFIIIFIILFLLIWGITYLIYLGGK